MLCVSAPGCPGVFLALPPPPPTATHDPPPTLTLPVVGRLPPVLDAVSDAVLLPVYGVGHGGGDEDDGGGGGKNIPVGKERGWGPRDDGPGMMVHKNGRQRGSQYEGEGGNTDGYNNKGNSGGDVHGQGQVVERQLVVVRGRLGEVCRVVYGAAVHAVEDAAVDLPVRALHLLL